MKPEGRAPYMHAPAKHAVSGALRSEGWRPWWEDVIDANKKKARQAARQECVEDEIHPDEWLNWATLSDINERENEHCLISDIMADPETSSYIVGYE